jgi:site-specific DNA-cytosine methylase
MQTVELFSGTASFSQVAERLGHKIFTIDNNSSFEPNLIKDINTLMVQDLPYKPDVFWASPPCQGFCIPAVRYHWKNKKPISKTSIIGVMLLERTIELIKILEPKYWFIENPMAMMRKQDIWNFIPHERTTVTYCQYGDTAMKPTDIWHNLYGWKGKRCKNGMNCHVSAPRGSKTPGSTQGKIGAMDRGRIPSGLFYEIFKEIEQREV